jgi:hypothetical protein
VGLRLSAIGHCCPCVVCMYFRPPFPCLCNCGVGFEETAVATGPNFHPKPGRLLKGVLQGLTTYQCARAGSRSAGTGAVRKSHSTARVTHWGTPRHCRLAAPARWHPSASDETLRQPPNNTRQSSVPARSPCIWRSSPTGEGIPLFPLISHLEDPVWVKRPGSSLFPSFIAINLTFKQHADRRPQDLFA